MRPFRVHTNIIDQRTIINFKVDLTEIFFFFNNIVISWVEAKTVTEIKFSAMMGHSAMVVPTSFLSKMFLSLPWSS